MTEEALGQVTHDILKTRFPKPLAEIAKDVAEKGRWEGKFVQTRKDGLVIVVASRWAAQRDESGSQMGVVEIDRNVAQRKQAEDSLEQAKIAARCETAQDEFLANMSHEIRTPITAILSLPTCWLLPACPTTSTRTFLEGIRRNGKALLDLISGILDLSRIEADKMSLESADCPLRQIIAH